jgi:hypothetical protein
MTFKQFFVVLCWKDNEKKGKKPKAGWYGNGETSPVGHTLYKAPVCCYKFFNKFLKEAATKFIPQCEGISGTIGALTIDQTCQGDEVFVSIDALMLDLARFNHEEDDCGAKVEQSENVDFLGARPAFSGACWL